MIEVERNPIHKLTLNFQILKRHFEEKHVHALDVVHFVPRLQKSQSSRQKLSQNLILAFHQ